MSLELYHHGVKGQKWGVRRYQYADGSLTPAGKKRYSGSVNSSSLSNRLTYAMNSARTKLTGKQYVDGYLKKGTTFSRVQTSDTFEKFAFYATYKKHDVEEYLGLFGKNLLDRANRDANVAEKIANKTKKETDIATAKELRAKANDTKIYQLKLEATKRLKIPSDENASDITADLLKNKEFKDNVIASIKDSKTKMLRPSQQLLFNQAQNAIRKDPSKMTLSEKIAVYKAFNLSLVHHNQQEIAAQNTFYSELKKKGYNALLDYNDKEFSSYHAKRPVIVFDVDSVKMHSVTRANPKVISKLNTRYNAERIIKEIPANVFGLIGQLGSKTYSECQSYITDKMNDYLEVTS